MNARVAASCGASPAATTWRSRTPPPADARPEPG
jgi:hypothetical protein